VLADLSFEQVLEYRAEHYAARRELGDWIDRLADQAERREWDDDFEHELAAISRQVRQIAEQPGRWKAASASLRANLTPGALAASSAATLTGIVAPVSRNSQRLF
jgi:uncharacterized protein YciW